MNNLSREQLAELTERVQERIAEFGNMAQYMPQLSAGVMRLIYDVIDEWQEQQSDAAMDAAFTLTREENGRVVEIAPWSSPIYTSPEPEAVTVETPAFTNGNGHHEAELSSQAVAALGPEHTVVTPLQVTKPRTLAEADDDELMIAALGSEEKAALMREIIGELQMISEDGEMPAMTDWDERKPEHLPKAQAICVRYKLNWSRLAEYARLRFDLSERRQKRHKNEAA